MPLELYLNFLSQMYVRTVADDNLKCISMKKISLKSIPGVQSDNMSSLVMEMAWHRTEVERPVTKIKKAKPLTHIVWPEDNECKKYNTGNMKYVKWLLMVDKTVSKWPFVVWKFPFTWSNGKEC